MVTCRACCPVKFARPRAIDPYALVLRTAILPLLFSNLEALMWRSLRVVSVLSACTILTYCGSPESLAPGPGQNNSADGDVEPGALKAGQLQTRNVDVPSGYTLADMNGSGDLLLGNAWLPKKGPNRPIALPFTGTYINDQQQIFGTELSYYQNGQVVPFGDPCVPITAQDNTGQAIVWDCSAPVGTLAQAQNGDAVVTYRQDATGTIYSPWHSLKVWRASTGQWQELSSIFSEDVSYSAVISNGGWVAGTLADAFSSFPRAFVFPPAAAGFDLSLTGACASPYPDGFEAHPTSVNDIGEVLGQVVCQLSPTDYNGVSAQWSSNGTPVPLGDFATLFDAFGNRVGTRLSDGHTVIWLVGGTTIDLTAAAGSQPVTARKFLKKRGEIFGFVGTQPVIWRFGF